MKKRDIDTEEIREAVKELEELASNCIKWKKSALKKKYEGVGKTNGEIQSSIELLVTGWEEMYSLVNKTKEFLSQVAISVDNADTESAKSFSK